MDGVLEVASWITLILGGAFCVVGGIGMWRLPDVFARLHAASLIDSLGIGFLALGMALQAGLSLVTLKLGSSSSSLLNPRTSVQNSSPNW